MATLKTGDRVKILSSDFQGLHGQAVAFFQTLATSRDCGRMVKVLVNAGPASIGVFERFHESELELMEANPVPEPDPMASQPQWAVGTTVQLQDTQELAWHYGTITSVHSIDVTTLGDRTGKFYHSYEVEVNRNAHGYPEPKSRKVTHLNSADLVVDGAPLGLAQTGVRLADPVAGSLRHGSLLDHSPSSDLWLVGLVDEMGGIARTKWFKGSDLVLEATRVREFTQAHLEKGDASSLHFFCQVGRVVQVLRPSLGSSE